MGLGTQVEQVDSALGKITTDELKSLIYAALQAAPEETTLVAQFQSRTEYIHSELFIDLFEPVI
jgi:hypothetical protein